MKVTVLEKNQTNISLSWYILANFTHVYPGQSGFPEEKCIDKLWSERLHKKSLK